MCNIHIPYIYVFISKRSSVATIKKRISIEKPFLETSIFVSGNTHRSISRKHQLIGDVSHYLYVLPSTVGFTKSEYHGVHFGYHDVDFEVNVVVTNL